jgi:hypothetical protein
MKRLTIVTVLLLLMVASFGCSRGSKMWGLRGARCAPFAPPPAAVMVPSQTVVPAAPITAYDPGCEYPMPPTLGPETEYTMPPAVIEGPPVYESIPGTIPVP